MFQKATRKQTFLKIGVDGPTGAGKTYGAILLAMGLGKRIAVIDSERGSAANYSNLGDFDHMVLRPPFTPERYMEAVIAAAVGGYDVVVIDSISHEWNGSGGLLEEKEMYDSANPRSNSYANWRRFSERHNKFTDCYLQAPIHVIATMRSKMDYSMEKDDQGKVRVTKQGLAPITGKEAEYEFDVVFTIVRERHIAVASKDRTGLFGDTPFVISQETGKTLIEWRDGAEVGVAQKNVPTASPGPQNDAPGETSLEAQMRVNPEHALDYLVMELGKAFERGEGADWWTANTSLITMLTKAERADLAAYKDKLKKKSPGGELAPPVAGPLPAPDASPGSSTPEKPPGRRSTLYLELKQGMEIAHEQGDPPTWVEENAVKLDQLKADHPREHELLLGIMEQLSNAGEA